MTNTQNNDAINEQENTAELPSKTERKKEMTALQDLGKKLTTLKRTQLDRLPLSDKLRSAIEEFNRLPNSHGAKRRQLQFIGRLMRDFNLQDIETAVQKVLSPQRSSDNKQQQLEKYCQQVFVDGDTGINSLLVEHEHLERQTLRKFYLDYRKAENLSVQKPVAELKARLLKYLKKNL